jgi:hypothetical protein
MTGLRVTQCLDARVHGPAADAKHLKPPFEESTLGACSSMLTLYSASSSYLTELVRGMTLEQAAKVKNTEIAKELVCSPSLLEPLDNFC